jgi:hypothetical protein
VEASTASEKRFGSTLFWRLFALINFFTVVWVIWLLWQITPRPVVNEFVLRLPLPSSRQTVSGSVPAAAPADAIPTQSGPPMAPLKLEKAIKVPPK